MSFDTYEQFRIRCINISLSIKLKLTKKVNWNSLRFDVISHLIFAKNEFKQWKAIYYIKIHNIEVCISFYQVLIVLLLNDYWRKVYSKSYLCIFCISSCIYIFGNTHVQRGCDVISFLLILNLLLRIIWKGELLLRITYITRNEKVQEDTFPRACNKNNLILDEYTERGSYFYFWSYSSKARHMNCKIMHKPTLYATRKQPQRK